MEQSNAANAVIDYRRRKANKIEFKFKFELRNSQFECYQGEDTW